MKQQTAINIILWLLDKGIFSHATWNGGAFHNNGKLELMTAPKQRKVLEKHLPSEEITVHETGESPKVKLVKTRSN